MIWMRRVKECLIVGLGVLGSLNAAVAEDASEGFKRGFVETVKVAGPSTVTIATLLPLDAEARGQWDRFVETQRRQLEEVNLVIRVGDEPYRYQGHGSGFQIDEKGHIVTNHHVVQAIEMDANVIFAAATGADGAWLPAELVGRDPSTDLAVLRCADSTATPAKWGKSEELEIGEFVLAIGTPRDLALRQTVTMGVVSAKGRSVGGLDYEDFIQTDASINPGNSGGPLVNVEGHVVGVNQSIMLGSVMRSDGSAAQTADGGAMQVDGNIGLGLAIPSSIARRVAEELVANGGVRRGFLGVRLEEASGEPFGMPGTCLKIVEVLSEGPAGDAGLKAGDLILSLNDSTFHSTRTFHLAVSLMKPDAEAALGILRKGEPQTVELKLGDLAKTRFASIGFDPEGRDFPGVPGVQLRVMQHPSGAMLMVVSQVDPSSAAAKQGLVAPSVITRVAGIPVESPDMFVAAATNSIQDGHLLLSVAPLGPAGTGQEREVSLKVE